MKPEKLITESDLSYFMKPLTVDDVETVFNSLILIRKHIDRDKNVEKEYFVKLYDKSPEEATSYKVASNAVGKEAIRNLTRKHEINDGGSESETSEFISFYSKDK
jgi:hypothetical protein